MNKNFVVVLLALVGTANLFAAPRFDAKAWRTLRSYDVRALSQNLDSHFGELVEIHFDFRGKDIHHRKPTWYESWIWQADPQTQKHFANVRVMVAKQDLKAFKSFPTSTDPAGEITVYGKVLRDSEAGYVFVRLLGRNTVVDSAGNVTVSW